MNNEFRTGTAFAVPVSIGYALCTLGFWIWPEAAVNFMNGLFHGQPRSFSALRTSMRSARCLVAHRSRSGLSQW